MSELPRGWVDCQLSDIVEIAPAFDRDLIHPSRNVHFIPMAAVEAETGNIDVAATRPYEEVRTGYTSFTSGDVLFAKITPCMENSKMAVVPALPLTVGFGSTEFHVLRPRADISASFVYYFVSARTFRQAAERNMTGAVGQRRVPRKYLEDHPISLPPLPEQRRIVAKMEELFSGLDDAEHSLTAARQQLGLYRQSLLKAAFAGHLTARWRAANKDKLETPAALLERIRTERESWYETEHAEWKRQCHSWERSEKIGPKPSRIARYVTPAAISNDELTALPVLPEGWAYVRLSEIAHVSSGMSVSKSRKYEDPIEVSYLRVANVQRGYLDLSEIKEMPVEKTRLQSLALRELDVLFNEGGDRDKLGRGWVWENKIVPCVTQNHVFRATLFQVSEPRAKLLSHWGNSYGQDYFLEEGKQTTNLASINQTVLKSLPVPLIPREEMNILFSHLEIASSVIDATEAEIATNLQKIASLRQAILKRAFAGRLVPQDPADEPAAALLERLRASTPACARRRPKSTRKVSA